VPNVRAAAKAKGFDEVVSEFFAIPDVRGTNDKK
jgi:hypothetical protein